MKKESRKPRHLTVSTRFEETVIPDGLRLNRETGEVSFTSQGNSVAPLTCEIDFAYQRPKKDKTVRKYPVSPAKIRLHPDAPFLNLDTVYVVDTNTDKELSVSCVLRGVPLIGEDGTKAGIRFRSISCLTYKGQQPTPERSAWRTVIQQWHSEDDGNTGMIVDSDLGLLDKFNDRSEPIIDDFYLPESIQLIYASADVGKEHFSNKVMAEADRAATRMLKQIRAEETTK